MKTWVAAILIGLLFSLGGFIYNGTCKDIDELKGKKADNTTIMIILEQNKEQRKEDIKRQEKKDDLQQKVNAQLMESIQMLLIKMVDKE